MQNLKKKLLESGHVDPNIQLSLTQYANKMARLRRGGPSLLDTFIEKIVKKVFYTRGQAHTNREIEEAVTPIVRKS